jgi:hypothetical protein
MGELSWCFNFFWLRRVGPGEAYNASCQLWLFAPELFLDLDLREPTLSSPPLAAVSSVSEESC